MDSLIDALNSDSSASGQVAASSPTTPRAQQTVPLSAQPGDPQSQMKALRAQVISLMRQVETLQRERAETTRYVEALLAERDYLRQVHAAALAFAQRLMPERHEETSGQEKS